MKNVKNVMIIIAAFVMGVIFANAGAYEEEMRLRNEIAEFSIALNEAETLNTDLEEFVEITYGGFCEYTEDKYNELVDAADEMADILEKHNLEVPDYNEDYYSDVIGEYIELVEPYAEMIADRCLED